MDGLDNSPVHVSFISYQVSHLVTEESLRVLFNRFGLVSDVSIKKSMIDQEMGRQSGYGFVYFSIHNDGVRAAVEAAQALTDTTIDEVNYKCSLAHNLMKFLNVDAAPPALAVPPAPVPAPAPVLVPPTAELDALSLNEAQLKASVLPARAVQHQSQGQHQGHNGGHQQQHPYQQAQAQAQAHAQQQYQHHQQQHQQQQAYQQQQQQQHMQQLQQQHLEYHPPVLMPQPMAVPMLSMDGQLMMQQAAQQQMAPPLSPISMAMTLPMGYGPQGSPVSYNAFVPTLPAGYMPMPPMPMAPMQLASSPAGGYRSYSSPSTNARTQTAMRMMMPPGTFMQQTGQMSPLSCTSSDSMKEEQLSYLNFLCSPVSSAVPNYFPHASPMSMPPSPFQPPFGNPQESPYIYPLWEHSRFKQPQAQGPAQQVRTNITQGNGHNSAGHSPKSPNSNSPRPPGPPPVSMAVPLRARAQRTASSKIRAALVISEAPNARAASPSSPAGVAVTPSVPVAEVVEVQS